MNSRLRRTHCQVDYSRDDSRRGLSTIEGIHARRREYIHEHAPRRACTSRRTRAAGNGARALVAAALARWKGAAALSAALLAVPTLAHATCTVVSAGPAYGKSWAERREELIARGDASVLGMTRLHYVPAFPAAPGCGRTVAETAPVRYRIGLIAPTWRRYGNLIAAAAQRHGVPAELILATIVDESGGNARAVATNPGYLNDAATPDRVSIGLGQMLISSARRLAPERQIDRAALFDPAIAIDLVARYHARFYNGTGFDPRLVASAYLWGSAPPLRAGQRWAPRDSVHTARYTAVVEASVAHLAAEPQAPPVSFAALFAR